MLRWTRELILERSSFEVCSISTSEVLRRTYAQFDVALLCGSIPPRITETLVRALKADHPIARVIRLSSGADACDSLFDGVCDPSFGPGELLAELERLRNTFGEHSRRLSTFAAEEGRGPRDAVTFASGL
jgi:hypothetical protein